MRKPVVRYALGVLVLLILWAGFRYFTSGRLVVNTTGSGGVISVTKLGEDTDSNAEPVATGSAKTLAARLRPGKYVVEIDSKAFSVSKSIEIKSRKTTTLSLNPAKRSDLEPVYLSDGRGIVADSTTLLYINPSSNTLYRIDSQNNVVAVDSGLLLSRISWADASFGVAQADDGRLFTVSGGAVQPLSVPFSTRDNKAVTFAVSADRQIFLSHGAGIYSGVAGGSFVKIYSMSGRPPSLTAWRDRVLVLGGPGDTSYKNVAPLSIILSKSGRVLSRASFNASSSAWSPDGKHVALVTDEGIEVVDSQLRPVATLQTRAISSLAWAEDTLYYTIDQNLWSFSVASGVSSIVSGLPAGSKLSDVTSSADGAYLYLTGDSGASSKGKQIYRLGLLGQPVPYYVYQFPSILPDNSTACSLSYVNFSQALVVGYASSNLEQICGEAVKTVFGPYGIDVGSLALRFLPTPAGE